MPNHVDDRLTAYLHDELDAAEVRTLEQHLAGCDACRDELAELQRADAWVAGLMTFEAPSDLWLDIERQLDALETPSAPGSSRRWWFSAAAAALVGLTFAGILLIDRGSRPAVRASLDMAEFLAVLEVAPRQENSREFGLLPAGFERVDAALAVRAAGLGQTSDDLPTPDSELYSGRVFELADERVYELIYGNADGPYLLFILPVAVEPEFGPRPSDRFPAGGPTCVRVASDGLEVFWDGDESRQWILVGRDHSDAFYAEVLRFVAGSS